MTKTEQRIWREKTAVRIEEIAKQREFLETLRRLALQVADTVEAKLVELHARSGHEKAGALPSRGPWIFRVTALNAAGFESQPSSNLVATFPNAVAGLRAVVGSVTTTTNWILVP